MPLVAFRNVQTNLSVVPPFEVLAYFRDAQEVITDTFHGSIFSIITHCKFVTLMRKSVGNSYGNEEKLTDLLKRLNLMDRMATEIRQVDEIMQKDISYTDVDCILKEARKSTQDYLETYLEI